MVVYQAAVRLGVLLEPLRRMSSGTSPERLEAWEGTMKGPGRGVVGVAIVGLGLGAAVAWAADQPAQGAQGSGQGAQGTSQEGVIDPRADTALRQMSNYVSGLKSFSVETKTVDENVTADGQKVQELKTSKVAVKRPHSLSIDRTGPRGQAMFRYDGKRYSLYGRDKNVFATAPAPATLDKAIDDARDRFNVDAPAGDLLVSNSYAALVDGLKTGRYIGLEPIDGVMAHHIAVTKKDVDYQIWIQDGPQPVPLRYVITDKSMPSNPQFTVELHNWRPDVPMSDTSFAFIAPPGAQKVEFQSLKQPNR
jgi:hypothetical protein